MASIDGYKYFNTVRFWSPQSLVTWRPLSKADLALGRQWVGPEGLVGHLGTQDWNRRAVKFVAGQGQHRNI
jgi:hypothetical protein